MNAHITESIVESEVDSIGAYCPCHDPSSQGPGAQMYELSLTVDPVIRTAVVCLGLTRTYP